MTGASLAFRLKGGVLCCLVQGLVTRRFGLDASPVASVRECQPCGQVLAVTYDFSGAAARLVAVKVAGDNCIPPGRAVWTVLAAPEVHSHPEFHHFCWQ